jgi:hypothetical protein
MKVEQTTTQQKVAFANKGFLCERANRVCCDAASLEISGLALKGS